MQDEERARWDEASSARRLSICGIMRSPTVPEVPRASRRGRSRPATPERAERSTAVVSRTQSCPALRLFLSDALGRTTASEGKSDREPESMRSCR